MAEIDSSKLLLFSACICCSNALYTDFPACVGADVKAEILCCREQVCLKADRLDKPLLCGTPEGTICELGLGCCAIALKQPEVLIKAKGQCFCCVQSAALPADAENPFMCAICLVTLFPKFGVALTMADVKSAAAPPSSA